MLEWFKKRGAISEAKRKAKEKKRLLSLGLRESEVEAWLQSETDDPSDAILQRKPSDKDFTEPKRTPNGSLRPSSREIND